MKRFLALAIAAFVAAAAAAEEPPVEYLNHLRAARRWLEAKQPGRAEGELVRALLVHARDADAWLELARACAQRDDHDGTLLAAHAALEVAPESAEAHAVLADLHARYGRESAALWHYGKAERLAEAGKPLDPDLRAQGVAFLAAVAQRDPAAADAARRAATAPGAAVRVAARYFGRARFDAGRWGGTGGGASVETGATLAPALLRALALDAAGFPAAAELAWDGAGGSTAGDGRLCAPAKPGAGTIRVAAKDGNKDLAVELPVTAVGPPAKLEIHPSEGTARAGQRLHLRLSPSDEAGRRLWLPEFAWSAEADGEAPGALARPNSVVASENAGEAHRNIYDVRREPAPAPGSAFRVIVRSPDGAVSATAAFTVEAGEAAARSRLGGIAWLDTYEEAVQQARERQTPLFVEVMADW